MSFEQEWVGLKQTAQTRLNGVGPGNGGIPDVKTNNSGKTAAVNALETKVQPGVQKAGVAADESTTAAVIAFADWQTAAGLKDAHAEWEMQVKSLQGRLTQDKEALRETKGHFQYTDHQVKGEMGQIADLLRRTEGQ
ncbi:hypothetical protein [Streptomyces sp. NPDC023838]|uniref:hypothetical protein n=1 Tax=Streptomyces sp. NPDC023838 TaxID=3154325 RepID=UPI00340FE098